MNLVSKQFSQSISLFLHVLVRLQDLVFTNVPGMELCHCFLPVPQPSLLVPTVEELTPLPDDNEQSVGKNVIGRVDLRSRVGAGHGCTDAF